MQFHRCWLMALLIALVNRVTGLENVEAYEGENVILPCIYSKRPLKDVTIFWRFYDDKNVYSFSGGKDLEDEDSQFKKRTRLFPSEHENGNFSLLLTNVKASDKGEYSCFYPDDNFVQKVELKVNGGPHPVTTMLPQGNNTAAMGYENFTLLVAIFNFISIILKCL
ncbi:hypothetical protein GN956_G3933 [Arapaima gigas]